MFIDEPIFFSPPLTKLNRKLHKGGGGGDGGAAERKAAEDARIAAAIKKLNETFGLSEATPDPVDKNQFYTEVSSNNKPVIGQANNTGFDIKFNNSLNAGTTRVFNQEAYDAAVAAAQAKADSLKGAAQARENLYSKIGTDANNLALVDLNKERGITERELNFNLARNGLSSGSRDIDANKDVLDTYQQGVLKASNIGSQLSNNARSNDEKTRVNLVNSIHAGLTEGDAITQAYSGMSNNAKSAQDDANTTSLEGFFDRLIAQQEKSQYNAGVQSTTGNIDQIKKSPYYMTMNKSYGGNTSSFGGK